MTNTSAFRRAFFDLPLAVFLLTAAIAAWAAYDRQAAWAKLWPIIGAVVLFYGLAWWGRPRLWQVAGLLALFGSLLAVYFLLTYNWQAEPVKIDFVNRIGLNWMAMRGGGLAGLPQIETDVAAGILGILAPFSFAVAMHWRQAGGKSKLPLLLLLAGLLTIMGALFLSAERGPWLGTAAAAGGWLWWKISAWASYRLKRSASILWGTGILFFVGAFLLLILLTPGSAAALEKILPGPAEAASRLNLWQNSLKLVGDFPFTGGGLASYPGLYSQYILVVPYFFDGSSHNMFVEVAIEQGIPGFLALLVIFFGSLVVLVFRLLRQPQDGSTPIWGAALAGFVVLAFAGMLENAFYSRLDVWLLFLLPGVAVSGIPGPASLPVALRRSRGQAVWAGGGIFLVILLALVGFGRHLLSAVYADLGAVQMAQVELADFPANRWKDSSDTGALIPAEALLQRSSELNPDNRDAQYHLGLIALLQRDFTSAVDHLERAYRIDPGHPGIRKTLGYSYAWDGKLDQSEAILKSVPEAKSEMYAYSEWWGGQGRPDLAEYARQMLERLY
ncbi:MAG TPA: O-antigen ligase family protein [Anaerolineales bacterium]